jgi:hypothetical protein
MKAEGPALARGFRIAEFFRHRVEKRARRAREKNASRERPLFGFDSDTPDGRAEFSPGSR